jgi:Flp pilus assembly protein TadD
MGWTSEDVFLVSDRAYSLFQQGRYREAAVLFEGLVAVDPGNSYCANALAACHYMLGEPQQTVAVLDRFLQVNPNDLEAHSRRCEALLQLGRTNEARQDLEFLNRKGAGQYSRRLRLLFENLRSTLLPA